MKNFVTLTKDSRTGYVLDLLRFERGIEHQFNTRCGEQQRERVSVKPPLHAVDIDDTLAEILLRPKNWDSLKIGLHAGSYKTLAWLRSRGIEARSGSAEIWSQL